MIKKCIECMESRFKAGHEKMWCVKHEKFVNENDFCVDFEMGEKTVAGWPLILCPKCGSELVYDRYVGFMNGNAYHEYDCTNPDCDFVGRIFKENIYE